MQCKGKWYSFVGKNFYYLPELQIIFSPMRIYPLIFDSMLIFKFQVVFPPLNFFRNAEKGKYYCLEGLICIFGSFDYSFGSDLLLLVVLLQTLVFLITLIIWEPLVICWQKDRLMDIVNPEVCFCLFFDNQYALLWTPNAYSDMLMRIFTPCLFFQCVFNEFQCVITLLFASSVALISTTVLECTKIFGF